MIFFLSDFAAKHMRGREGNFQPINIGTERPEVTFEPISIAESTLYYTLPKMFFVVVVAVVVVSVFLSCSRYFTGCSRLLHSPGQEIFVRSDFLLDLGTDFLLVAWSLYEMLSILRKHIISMARIFLCSSAVRVHDLQAYRKMDVTRQRIRAVGRSFEPVREEIRRPRPQRVSRLW